jgi:hypothetical protein
MQGAWPKRGETTRIVSTPLAAVGRRWPPSAAVGCRWLENVGLHSRALLTHLTGNRGSHSIADRLDVVAMRRDQIVEFRQGCLCRGVT